MLREKIFANCHQKTKVAIGLEEWLSGEECVLLFQRTPGQFPAPICGITQPAPGNPATHFCPL